jgi:hypothetical protein
MQLQNQKLLNCGLQMLHKTAGFTLFYEAVNSDVLGALYSIPGIRFHELVVL